MDHLFGLLITTGTVGEKGIGSGWGTAYGTGGATTAAAAAGGAGAGGRADLESPVLFGHINYSTVVNL